MQRVPVTAFLVFMTSGLVAVATVGTHGCSSNSEATADTSDTNRCHTYPGMDDPCSSTNPCPAPLTCYYEPGCDMPIARCRIWDLCTDTGMETAFCGCDGGATSNKDPYAYSGLCRDAALDGETE